MNTTKNGQSFSENICHNCFFSISRRHVGRITNMSSDASNLDTVFDIHKIMFYSTDHTRREKTSSCLFSRAKFRLAIPLLGCALFLLQCQKIEEKTAVFISQGRPFERRDCALHNSVRLGNIATTLRNIAGSHFRAPHGLQNIVQTF